MKIVCDRYEVVIGIIKMVVLNHGMCNAGLLLISRIVMYV